jgi:hypothetical protein
MKLFALIGILTWACMAIGSIGLSIYGLVLAFQASTVLGVLVFIVEPSPLIIGLVAFFGRHDVAYQLAHWLGL